jgi:septal ring factor EnvC (AmiA/AmiB activator)
MRKTIAALLLCLSASPAAAQCFQQNLDDWRACTNQQFQIEQMNQEMDQLWKRQEQIEQERARREGRIYMPPYRPLHLPW